MKDLIRINRPPHGINSHRNNNNKQTPQHLEGWACKQGGRFANWKNRYFLLINGCLCYYRDSYHIKPIGIIYLSQVSIELDQESLMIVLTPRSRKIKKIMACKVLDDDTFKNSNHKCFKIVFSSQNDLREWSYAISQTIKHNDDADIDGGGDVHRPIN